MNLSRMNHRESNKNRSFFFDHRVLAFLAGVAFVTAMSQACDALLSLTASDALTVSDPALQKRSTSKSTDTIDDGDIPRQRVVLFAGPHKTGSSSVQFNLRQWLSSDDESKRLKSLSDNWAWPIPPKITTRMQEKNIFHSNPFVFFTHHLRGVEECKDTAKLEKLGMSCQFLKDLFREEFLRQWEDGKSLLLANEGFDFVGSDIEDKRIEVSKILDEMPWNLLNNDTSRHQHHYNSNDDVTVVVNWRAPRAEHFISTYHECSCMKTETFNEYASNPQHHLGYKSIDSLLVVEKFLDAGLNVIVVDVNGVQQRGFDLPNVIACDVMEADCTSNKIIVGQTATPDERNVKKNKGDMGTTTDMQLEELENVIRQRDCSFQHLKSHPRLQVLYDSELSKVWDDCKLKNESGISREGMKDKINRIFAKS